MALPLPRPPRSENPGRCHLIVLNADSLPKGLGPGDASPPKRQRRVWDRVSSALVGKRRRKVLTGPHFRPVPLPGCIEPRQISPRSRQRTPDLWLISGSGHCAGTFALSFETDLAARKRRQPTNPGRSDQPNWTRTNNRRAETISSGILPGLFGLPPRRNGVPKLRSNSRLLIRISLPRRVCQDQTASTD